MSRTGRDPHEIPDDASGAQLAGYVGEDVGRQLMVRLTLFVALLCVLGGVATDADPGVKAAAATTGGVGVLLLLWAALARWRRSRQWVLIAVVLTASVVLLAVVLVQHNQA